MSNSQSQVLDKGLWGMAKPMLFEQALIFTIPLMDTFFLSQVSDQSAAAVGTVMALIYFSHTFIWVTAFAGGSVASQRIGSGDYDKANGTIFVYGIWLFVQSILSILFLYFAGPTITNLMGLPDDIKPLADTYLSIAAFMVGTWGLRSIVQSVLTIYGLPKFNLISNFVAFGLNFLGNGMVVFGWFGTPELGLVGVAWVSVLSSIAGFFVASFAVLVKINIKFDFKLIKTKWRDFNKQIADIVGPSVVEPLSFDINMIVLAAIVARVGSEALAARTFTFNTYLAMMVITVAFSTANEVIIAQLVGAKKYQEAKKQMSQTLKIVLSSNLVLGGLFLLLAPQIMGLYTTNSDIIAMSAVYFFLALASDPGRSVNIISGNALRGLGDGWFISVVGVCFTWSIALPLAYVLAIPMEYGLVGVLIAAAIDEGTRSIIYYWRWRQNKWQQKNVIAKESKEIPSSV